MIIPIDAEKSSDKMQHLFMIKILSKVALEGTYLNIVQAIYGQLRVNITLDVEKLKAFPLRKKQDKDFHSHHFHSI